ncbi:MAG: tetratricopeptide repeat protein [Sphingobium sp.]|uniref:tetratricopeptide repeat protein n=1 Tax=Sphingobium sp. TaxID=1912891 RepID=UPI002E1FE62B
MRTAPWIIVALLLSGAAHAQSDQADLVRPAAAADLNSNLARLASNPRDTSALIGAGEAALALDDARAAAGFFARADAIESGNGRIKAGLARVMLKLQNPAEALRLFDQAARLGYPDASVLADRGLAKDMTGDQAGAQRDYYAALARSPRDDELVRRYAASLGISGQVDASEKVLEPLLYKSDRAAWRYRAFILAMNNRQADARKVADQTMPAQLAAAIAPYMQKMPYLTAAQKAAAVHFGHFPQQIGTTIAAVTPTPPAPGITVAAKQPVAVAAAPTSQANPLSRAEQRRQRREAARLARTQAQQQPVRTAAATPTPTPVPQRQVALAEPAVPTPQPAPVQPQPLPPVAPQANPPRPAPQTVQSIPAAPAAPADTPARQAQAQIQTPAQAPSQTLPAQVQGPPAPGFDTIDAPPAAPASAAPSAGSQLNAITLAQAAAPAAPVTPTVQPLPAAAPPPPPPAPTPQPNPEATRTLADIIRAIDVPEAERATSIAAVNLDEVAALQAQRRAERQAAAKAAADKAKKEAAAKAKAEADAKAKKEAEEKKRLAANPSRNWLQVGVGQSKSALGFTMKGLRKKYASLAAQDAWSASWGRTNRLLVGPFASFTRAKEVESKLKADGADVFAWKSEAGEVVERLGGE